MLVVKHNGITTAIWNVFVEVNFIFLIQIPNFFRIHYFSLHFGQHNGCEWQTVSICTRGQVHIRGMMNLTHMMLYFYVGRCRLIMHRRIDWPAFPPPPDTGRPPMHYIGRR